MRACGLRFPASEDMPDRLGTVLDAIYAAFGQGWDSLDRAEAPEALTGEAIWLARLLVSLMPEEPEPKGLLALMLYCNARRAARRDARGASYRWNGRTPRCGIAPRSSRPRGC